MGKLFVVVMIVLCVPAFVAGVAHALRPTRPSRPDDVLSDEQILAAAQDNRNMLEDAVRILAGILDDDKDLAFLRERRRSEAKALVGKYNTRLGKEPQ